MFNGEMKKENMNLKLQTNTYFETKKYKKCKVI